MKLLVTGVLGFIGSHFAKYILRNSGKVFVVGTARNSDQKALQRIVEIRDSKRFQLIYADLAGDISGLVEGIDVVINFAAKTFVDHSIKDPAPFIRSNIVGTYNLLEQARKYKPKLFFQIGTDEVYGGILSGFYKEDAPLNPGNPYSSTKAAQDMMVLAYHNTYGLPIIITRTENNYGSFQHPQKVLPVFVKKALRNDPLPVYGDGKHKRMWLRVEDHCAAIWHLIQKGIVEEIYHVAGKQELENVELARIVLRTLDKSEDLIEFIPDHDIRPGHDRRYALDTTKIQKTGWSPKYTLEEGLKEVISWYANHPEWLY